MTRGGSDAAAEALIEDAVDGRYAWRRLWFSLALSIVGGVGLWSYVVVLSDIQREFGVDRGGASLIFTLTLIGFVFGGVAYGRLADRVGIVPPLLLGALFLGVGYAAAAAAQSYWQFALAQALAIGAGGSAAFFGPLVADVSLWFRKRRGIAVAVVASGNYLAGALWSPLLQRLIDAYGWRWAYLFVALCCVVAIPPLALLLRRRFDVAGDDVRSAGVGLRTPPLPLPALQVLLVLAGIACCVAMAMPQVHIVAYCIDLGYGSARGAEMLSLMLFLGVVSRLASGLIADVIGGAWTLMLGSTLQCLALLFYLPFDGMLSLYLVSALFGLSQGGIVPSYALIVRDYFPAREAGSRISLVLMATVFGMALGGWLSGEIYDWTGSYQAAFLNGVGWNLVNMAIAGWLLLAALKPPVLQRA